MPNVITDPARVDAVLDRAVETVYPTKEAFRALLLSGRRLRFYTGVDPTSPDLHIGHTTWMWKLREFQDLGHEVIMLIGSFTAMIGDPTDKLATRKQLTREDVLKNVTSYKKAASKILRFRGENPVKIMWNHKWFDKMALAELLPLMSNFTVQQMLERDMFEKRMAAQKPIGLHEFMYPLMQGYDSVAMNVDVEIGGSDQTFNMLAGRTLLRALKNKEKFVVAVPLLQTPNGVKMGKSEGNAVPILTTPEDMFGKIMALDDGFVIPVFTNLTRVPLEEISKVEAMLASGGNPRDAKIRLATELVSIYHNKAAAKRAKKHFETVFQKHEMPTDIREVSFPAETMPIADLLVAVQFAASKSEARRLIEQGGVKVQDAVVAAPDAVVSLTSEGVIVQRGKQHFVRVKRG